MNDYVYICVYCGETMDSPSERALEMFGDKALACCEHPMVKIDADKMYVITRALEKLRENLEKRVVEGIM